ncbi:MAG: response regulator [Deltaproteobacteria bacterium]|nr:response regulator [Deltaproteobacteria bacterium]
MSRRPTKILLVEDNPADAKLLQATFDEVGSHASEIELVEVPRLADAIRRLQEANFDLVLLGLSLPDSQGVATVARVKEVRPNLPIVVLTGHDDDNVAANALRQGAQDYLVKGQIDRRILLRAIRYAIERKKSEAEINRQLERQRILNDINSAVASTLDLQSVMNILLEKVGQVFPQFGSMVHLLSPQKDVLEALVFRNVDAGSWQQTVPGENKGFNSITAHMKTPLVIKNAQNDPRSRRPEFLRRNGFVCYLGLPLIVKDEAVGVLALFSKENDAFADADIQFLSTLAGQAAIAIHNAQLYDKLKRANETLEQTLEVKSILTGVMAHELKTPIQVIMGSASLLADGMCGELNQEQRERVGKIEAGSEEMLRLIESSLDMARLERGKMPLLVTEIRVRELLAELESEFSEAFAEKGLALEVSQPPLDSTIKSDRVKLKEILRNIIDNARKYTAHGKVSLEFAVKDADRVEFVVSDTGIGIKAELLPKIFELFYQVEPSQKEHASAGLGLNIVKRLVGAMSGEIDVTSEVGRGSAFRVTFPREISTHLPQ